METEGVVHIESILKNKCKYTRHAHLYVLMSTILGVGQKGWSFWSIFKDSCEKCLKHIQQGEHMRSSLWRHAWLELRSKTISRSQRQPGTAELSYCLYQPHRSQRQPRHGHGWLQIQAKTQEYPKGTGAGLLQDGAAGTFSHRHAALS